MKNTITVSQQTVERLTKIAKQDNKTIDEVILWLWSEAEKEAHNRGVTLEELITSA